MDRWQVMEVIGMIDWIPWSDHYIVGIDSIDEQHRELFRRFNQVCDAVWDGQGKESIRNFLHYLAQYTQEHFGNEETNMRKHGYPAYEAHKKAHDSLVADVSVFVEKYETEDVPADVVVKVISDLGDWTRNHIRLMDQELGRFLQAQK